jgi:hypothetical protein
MRTQINNTLLLGAMLICGVCKSQNTTNVASGTEFRHTSGLSSIKDDDVLRKARFGFKASPNFAWVKVLEGRVKANGMGLGVSYGIMADFNIAGNASYWLGTELIVTSFPGKIAAMDTLYNRSTIPSGAPYTKAEFDYKLQYVQIPITLKLKTNEIGNLIYWGQFGLSPGFMIQNKVTTNTVETFYEEGTTSHSPNSGSNDPLDFEGRESDGKGKFEDNVIPLRMSLVLGLGVEFKISGKTAASLGLRFDNGFTDLFWDKAVKGRNNYLGLHAGVYF